MAGDLIQMTKRGFTFKKLPESLAGEDIEIKASTLNRYLNECPAAKDIPEKSKAGSKTTKRKAAPRAKRRSDSSSEWEVVTSTVNEE